MLLLMLLPKANDGGTVIFGGCHAAVMVVAVVVATARLVNAAVVVVVAAAAVDAVSDVGSFDLKHTGFTTLAWMAASVRVLFSAAEWTVVGMRDALMILGIGYYEWQTTGRGDMQNRMFLITRKQLQIWCTYRHAPPA